MKSKRDRIGWSRFERAGFSLIVTLGVMILLSFLAVGILSLSSVVLRSGNSDRDRLIARSNARLALVLALGELQKLAGPDTRVTAPADALAGTTGASPYVTGVWRSWEGLDHEQSSGLPFAPNYDSKKDSFDENEGRFLGWLISGSTADEASAPPSVALVTGEEATVPLVAEGTIGRAGTDQEVHVRATEIGDNGSYAWWVQGENTKALIAKPQDEPETASGWSERLVTNGRADLSEFGFSNPDELSVLPTRNSMNLVAQDEGAIVDVAGTFFHDVTTNAKGLLTNTATGGWRRDLSLMSEQWDELPSSNLPFFTLEPGVETKSAKNSGAVGGLIYPWAQESDFQAQGANKVGGASMGWGGLVDFALQYQQAELDSMSEYAVFERQKISREEIDRRPVLARIHWVFSFASEKKDDGDLKAQLLSTPVLTYWNPYNVALKGSTLPFQVRVSRVIPYAFQFSVAGVNQAAHYEVDTFAQNANFNFVIPGDNQTWQPGESRVYGPAADALSNNLGIITLEKGFVPGSGFLRDIFPSYSSAGTRFASGVGDAMSGPGTSSFGVSVQRTSVDYTLVIEQNAVNGGGATDTVSTGVEHFFVLSTERTDPYWPQEQPINNDSINLQDVDGAGAVPSPFFVAVVQLRNIKENSTKARGYSLTKPIQAVSSSGIVGLSSPELYPESHPYDWFFAAPNDVNDAEFLPQGGEGDDAFGFVGTSFRADEGLTSLVIAEVPTRPLRSLGELQHFDINGYNPMPPFVANAIGNSNASFLIEPSEVEGEDSYSQSQRVSYDHSFVANHLLFDDWFVSSISPETAEWSSSQTRSTTEVYRDFVARVEPLPNEAYQPANPSSLEEAEKAAEELMADRDSWHEVASQIEVEGMFNIKSTSVEAWKALLKHSRDAEVPFLSDGGGTVSTVGLEGETGTAVSRTSVAGDPAAQLNTSFSEIGTHRRLSDSQIEIFAMEIVSQIQQRGPFLSLSEFVNRQLVEGDSDLSLAGAVESALAVLIAGEDSPLKEVVATFPENTERKEPGADDGFSFPEAFDGNESYGFPGWMRQADILRPLAPVLTVRDDTFLIRAYGASRNPSSGEVLAESWCEAVVQRRADYMDSQADEATVLPSDSTLTSEVNQIFGRRFEILSFRWLSANEV